MKSIDIRSESAVKLMAEFLDMDSGGDRKNAEHFAHGKFKFILLQSQRLMIVSIEVYCYLRSPYRDLAGYDAVVQVSIHLPFSCFASFPICFLIHSMMYLKIFHLRTSLSRLDDGGMFLGLREKGTVRDRMFQGLDRDLRHLLEEVYTEALNDG